MDFPRPYYIDAEGGARLGHYQAKLLKSGGVYFGPEDGANDFNSVVEQIKALATEKHEFQTLVIGSITKLYQTAIAQEAERLGDKDGFGASKKPAIKQLRSMFNWIMRIDMNVVLEAHEVIEWGKNPKNDQREEIGQNPDVWEKVVYEMDLVLRLEKHGMSRYAIPKKSRLLGFPEGDRFACDYEAFADRYGRDFIQAPVVPIELATPEQVADIVTLLDILKIEESALEKIMKKAGAENWSELSTAQAADTIAWLRGKVK
jgi:hypothetical protein